MLIECINAKFIDQNKCIKDTYHLCNIISLEDVTFMSCVCYINILGKKLKKKLLIKFNTIIFSKNNIITCVQLCLPKTSDVPEYGANDMCM